ncbi:hypothetical protein ACKKBG_A24110 [Auxenochlorella protothecoides x Auxenochlorella symbiontica]
MKRGKPGQEGQERTLPLLPLSTHVLLPGGMLTVAVQGNSHLIKHLVHEQGRDVMVAAVPYSPDNGEDHGPADSEGDQPLDHDRLFHTGTAAKVVQLHKSAKSGVWTLSLEGQSRVRVGDVTTADPAHGPYFARVAQLDHFGGAPPANEDSAEEEALARSLLTQARRLSVRLQGPARGAEAARRIAGMLRAGGRERMADVLGSLAARTRADRLLLLGTLGLAARMRLVGAMLDRLLAVLEGAGARPGTALVPVPAPRGGAVEQGQDPAEGEPEDEVQVVLARLAAARPPPAVLAAARREAKRLARGADHSPAYAMGLTYLETLADLPWDRWSWQLEKRAGGSGGAARVPGEAAGGGVKASPSPASPPRQPGASPTPSPHRPSPTPPPPSPDALPPDPTLASVRAALDAAHSGLDSVKARIVQYVAVQRLRGWDARAPVLCLVGPPGVGKTSLAASVADCLRRPLHRISLGGVRDEAEVRGHRRTYVGAMPGRVLQGLRRAGARDAVLLLDEVDKMGRDSRGDPAAALLEVLDPEQNAAFVDTYLGLPFDLSAVLFLATANRAADIPEPLLDRMEVIHLPGYTLEEKMAIAERHLVPRVLADHGMTHADLAFPADSLRLLVEGYTREAGVRSLARAIAAVCRHVAVDLVATGEGAAEPTPEAPEARGQGADPATPDALGGLGAAGAPGPGAAGVGVVQRTPCVAGSPAAPALVHAPGLHAAPSSCTPPAAAACGEADLASMSGLLSHPLPPQRAAAAPPPSSRAGASPGLGWFSRLVGPGRGAEASPRAAPPGGVAQARRRSAPSPPSVAPTPSVDGDLRAIAGLRLSPAADPAAALAPPPRRRGPMRRAPRRDGPLLVTPALIEAALRSRRFDGADAAERVTGPGAAAGLVWTAAGGAVQYIECIAVGRGRAGRSGTLTLTGQLGEVLGESARIALSWVRAHAGALGLEDDRDGAAGRAPRAGDGDGEAGTRSSDGGVPGPAGAGSHRDAPASPAACWDVHVHLPAGAVPKDGPSAGVTLAVALVSLFAGRTVRADVAMTGELTLRGLVLPVGGVKEKLLAAHAAGVRRALVPVRNLRDVRDDLPASVREDMQVLGCQRMEEVLAAAFDPPLRLRHTPARL